MLRRRVGMIFQKPNPFPLSIRCHLELPLKEHGFKKRVVVEELIQRLRGRLTVVIVTHNLAQARRIANYAAFFWMKERVGKLVEFSQCRSLFDTPQDALTQAYVSGAAG